MHADLVRRSCARAAPINGVRRNPQCRRERWKSGRGYRSHSTPATVLAMPYAIVQPPFTLNLREMPKSGLKCYFQWFMDVLPQRVKELAEAVRETPGFEAWQADNTPASLSTLGEWFIGQIETRDRTQEEVHEIRRRQEVQMDVPSEELTNQTFSLAMDIGMYLSLVLLKTHPSLKWEQPLGGKRFVDYGQPSLSGFGRTTLNPVRIVVTLAYELASKKRSGNGLREIFDIWSKMVLA